MRISSYIFVFIFFGVSASAGEGVTQIGSRGCDKPYLSSKEFVILSDTEKSEELDRLADGLSQGCDIAFGGLNYLSTTIPEDQTVLLKWYRLLVEVSEIQSSQVIVQKSLIDQFLEKIKQLSDALELETQDGLDWRSDKAKLVSDLEKASAGLADREAQLDTLEKKQEADNNLLFVLADKEARLRNDYNDLRTKLGLCNADVKQLKDRIRGLREDILKENAAVARLNDEVHSLNGSISDLDAEILRLNDIIVVKDGELDVQNEEIQKLEHTIATQAGVHAVLSEKIEAQKQEIAALKETISEQELKIQEQEITISNLEQKLADLSYEFEILKAELLDANNKISDLNAKIADLKARIEALKTENEELRAIIEGLVPDIKLAIEEKGKAEGERDLYKRQFDELHKQYTLLDKYRSDFFEKLSSALEGIDGISVDGDRFVLQAEVFFKSGSAEVSIAGRERIAIVAILVAELSKLIPSDIGWILQVNGHTDIERIAKGSKFRDNWQLSTERALAVVDVLISAGVTPKQLAAAGYGEFQPVNFGTEPVPLAANRRIELRLTNN